MPETIKVSGAAQLLLVAADVNDQVGVFVVLTARGGVMPGPLLIIMKQEAGAYRQYSSLPFGRAARASEGGLRSGPWPLIAA